jgi:hypothetical protein
MKKIRLLALFIILMGVVVNAYSGGALDCTLRCDSGNDPSLCVNGEDIGCSDFCGSSEQCNFYGFYNVYGTCGGLHGNNCVCRGCNDG